MAVSPSPPLPSALIPPHSPLTTDCRSYRALAPRTRILIGVGLMAYAGAGLLVSDKAEQAFGYTPSEEDRRRLREVVPRVHLVDREEGGIGGGGAGAGGNGTVEGVKRNDEEG